MPAVPPICIVVLAHNEEARIATCLASLPLGDPGVAIHVVVNGSTDATAAIVKEIAVQVPNLDLHIYEEGGKARSWSRFLFDELAVLHDVHVFVDGDAEVIPGSIAALAATLTQNPQANAASALPMNGRNVAAYQQGLREEHGLFGDLYALTGDFLHRMKAGGIRLPDDLIGDDGLICALAKTDLGNENNWHDERVAVCEQAGFLCAPADLLSPKSWHMQYRRMINYSVRHFQNRMISRIMRDTGPKGLPRRLAEIYRRELPGLSPRPEPQLYFFDTIALRRMANMVEPD
jgi:glycosyltransferase involved in cell wall biosynthesis